MVLCFSAALNRNITSNLQLWIRRNHSATKNQRLCPKQRIYFAYVVGILITIETYRFIIVKLQRIKNMDKYELQTTSIEKSLLPITRPLWKKCRHTSDKHSPHFICQASGNPECASNCNPECARVRQQPWVRQQLRPLFWEIDLVR